MIKNMSLKLLIVTALCMLATSAVRAQTAMSLSDCVLYALDKNPNIRVAQLQITDADWRIKESTSTGLPQLTGSVDYTYFIQRGGIPASIFQPGAPSDVKIAFSPVHNLGGKIQLSQLIFSNSYLLALKASRFYRDYVNEQMTVAKQQLRNNVTDAYLPALLLSENVGILDKNIGNLEKLLSETKAITKAGFGEQLDVDRLDLSLANLRSERGNLVRQQEMVVNALKLTMGMPVGESITLSDDVDKLMALYADADLTSQPNLMNRSEYVQLLKGRDLGTLQVELYNRPWLPTVAGFVQYQPAFQGGFSSDNKKWYWIPQALAGISINIPIYDGGGTKAHKQRAIIAVQTIDAQKQLLENAIALEVENARKQYLNAAERVKNQQKNLELAQRIYDTTQTKYKAGIGSSFELVSAEQALYTAQQSLMQVQHELLTAKVSVRKALGAN